MTLFLKSKKPSQAQKLEAEAEAGPRPMSEDNDQSVVAADTDKEKAMNKAGGHSPSASSGAMAENQESLEPPAEEKKRSMGKTVLLMIALCV